MTYAANHLSGTLAAHQHEGEQVFDLLLAVRIEQALGHHRRRGLEAPFDRRDGNRHRLFWCVSRPNLETRRGLEHDHARVDVAILGLDQNHLVLVGDRLRGVDDRVQHVAASKAAGERRQIRADVLADFPHAVTRGADLFVHLLPRLHVAGELGRLGHPPHGRNRLGGWRLRGRGGLAAHHHRQQIHRHQRRPGNGQHACIRHLDSPAFRSGRRMFRPTAFQTRASSAAETSFSPTKRPAGRWPT